MWDLPFTPLTSRNAAFAAVTADVGSPVVGPQPGEKFNDLTRDDRLSVLARITY